MRKLTTLTATAFLLASSAAAFADGTPSLKDAPAPATPPFDIAFGGGVASDYIFRGISQSARWPSANAYTEFRYNVRPDVQFYSAIGGASIDFPNRAAAEIDLYGGIRPTFGKLALDIGYWYYWYPGGRMFDGSTEARCTNGFYTSTGFCNGLAADLSFWEVFGKATYAPNDTWTFGANVYYSPSWLNTGADGTYASGTLKYVVPTENLLPKDFGASLSGEFGHYWFGQTGWFYGYTDLPEYNTWNAGLSFTYKVFTLDLRYYDTDLSKSECNVLTGDHTAGYSPSNITSINPSGLGSNWCGSAFVAKLSFDMTANTNLK
jgi:uncharacterized protein (TIGR02001 family)